MIIAVSEVSESCSDGAGDVVFCDTSKLDLADPIGKRVSLMIEKARQSKRKSTKYSYFGQDDDEDDEDYEDFLDFSFSEISVTLPQMVEDHITIYRE